MKTVLVTGGAGLIGSTLCRKLVSMGYCVLAIDNMSLGTIENVEDLLSGGRFILINENLLNLSALNKVFEEYNIDTIYHLASNTSIPRGQQNMELDFNNTFLITINLLQMASKYKIKKFVFTSSSTIYGNSEYDINEYTLMHPISFYGAAKMSCEAFISAFSSCFNIQAWILRLCNVVGTHVNHGIVYDLKQQINNGNKIIKVLGDGCQEKPFLYVDDAIEGIIYVTSNTTEMLNIYLIGNRDTITIHKIAEIALEENKIEAGILVDKTPTWSGDVQKYKYDISKVVSLGWEPRYTSEEAIRKSFKK